LFYSSEVKEETGYDVEITSILSVMSNFLRAGLHTLVVVLEASIISGEPSPGDDIVELGWFPLDGPFPDMAFEADRNIIKLYLKPVSEAFPSIPNSPGQVSGNSKAGRCHLNVTLVCHSRNTSEQESSLEIVPYLITRNPTETSRTGEEST
jgi:hypothetical protein